MKKIFLSELSCLGFVVAVLSGVWYVVCEQIGLASWVGFAGCTSYFACGKKGVAGVITAISTNISGVIWAIFSIYLGGVFDFPLGQAISCAIISYAIIIQAKIKKLQFIPGAYIGCFITFGMMGNWQQAVVGLVIGVFIGYVADILGKWVYTKV